MFMDKKNCIGKKCSVSKKLYYLKICVIKILDRIAILVPQLLLEAQVSSLNFQNGRFSPQTILLGPISF